MKRLDPSIKEWKLMFNPQGAPTEGKSLTCVVEALKEVVWSARRAGINIIYGGFTTEQVTGTEWAKIRTGIHAVQMVGEDVYKSMHDRMGHANGFNLKRFQSLDNLDNLLIQGSHSGLNINVYGGDIAALLLDLKATAWHEVGGHGLGFGHVKDEYSIMNNKAIPHHWMSLSTLFDRERTARVYTHDVVDCTPQATQNQLKNDWGDSKADRSLLIHLPLFSREGFYYEATLVWDRIEGDMQIFKAAVREVQKVEGFIYINYPSFKKNKLHIPRVNYAHFFTSFAFQLIDDSRPDVWDFMGIDAGNGGVVHEQDYAGNITNSFKMGEE